MAQRQNIHKSTNTTCVINDYTSEELAKIDFIKDKLQSLIGSNVMVQGLLAFNPQLKKFVETIPELVLNESNTPRGLKLLQVTGLYDFLLKQ